MWSVHNCHLIRYQRLKLNFGSPKKSNIIPSQPRLVFAYNPTLRNAAETKDRLSSFRRAEHVSHCSMSSELCHIRYSITIGSSSTCRASCTHTNKQLRSVLGLASMRNVRSFWPVVDSCDVTSSLCSPFTCGWGSRTTVLETQCLHCQGSYNGHPDDRPPACWYRTGLD